MVEKYVELLDALPYIKHAAFVDSAKDGYFIPWRILYDFELMYVIEGDITVEEQDRKYTLHKYDLHIMPPNVWHTRYVKNDAHCQYYNIHFEFGDRSGDPIPPFNVREVYVNPILERVKECKVNAQLYNRTVYKIKDVEFPRCLRVDEAYLLTDCLDRLIDAHYKADAYGKVRVRGMFEYILGLILAQMNEKQSSSTIDNVIEKFKALVRVSYGKKIDVKEFAESFGYSYVYFRNSFKRAVGVSPLEYIQNEKFSKAFDLQQGGMYSVTQVAEMLDFKNMYYFSAQFKKKTGVNPSSIQKPSGNQNRKTDL